MSDETRATLSPDVPESALTPANQNPWYILMTLYGEQEGDRIDRELAAKNRRAWNAWAGQALSAEEQEKYASGARIALAELGAWEDLKDEIAERHYAEWQARADGLKYPSLPDPVDRVDLSRTSFSNPVISSP